MVGKLEFEFANVIFLAHHMTAWAPITSVYYRTRRKIRGNKALVWVAWNGVEEKLCIFMYCKSSFLPEFVSPIFK